MDRVFKSDVSDIAPQPPETPLIGYPKDGNPMTGTPATKPGEWWFHMMTEEMRNAIIASGQTPDPKRVDQLADAIRSTGQHIANASGTANDLTVDFMPSVSVLSNGLTVFVRANEESTISTPTLKANNTQAKTIVKGDNLPLAAGDIAGAGHWLEMQYDGQLDKWVLQNPAKGITPQSGVPIGTIEYFATATPPAGYLKADGAAVGRTTYPDLFAAIGTTFGEGDGETTFNLPDLIDRFAQGSTTPGQKIEAGLPNITGEVRNYAHGSSTMSTASGAFARAPGSLTGNAVGGGATDSLDFDASRSTPIYGASDTVQPPALTLLPCIKAFDAATNPGLIDITELANEMAGKVDRYIDNKPVRYVIDAYNDSNNWYRKWSDGWVEQGGILNAGIAIITITFLLPFSDDRYCILKNVGSSYESSSPGDSYVSFYNLTKLTAQTSQHTLYTNTRWYACGQGEQS